MKLFVTDKSHSGFIHESHKDEVFVNGLGSTYLFGFREADKSVILFQIDGKRYLSPLDLHWYFEEGLDIQYGKTIVDDNFFDHLNDIYVNRILPKYFFNLQLVKSLKYFALKEINVNYRIVRNVDKLIKNFDVNIVKGLPGFFFDWQGFIICLGQTFE